MIATEGLPRTGRNFSLTCNVTADEDLISGLSVGWFSNGSEVMMNTTTRTILSHGGTSFKVVTLVFVEAVMEDEGNYTCRSMLSVPGSLSPPLVVNDTTNIGTIGML